MQEGGECIGSRDKAAVGEESLASASAVTSRGINQWKQG